MNSRALPGTAAGAIVRPPAVESPVGQNAPPAGPAAGPPGEQERSVPRKRRRIWKLVRWALLVLLIPPLAAAGVVFAWTRKLPTFETLRDYDSRWAVISTRVLAVDGTEVFQFSRERRTLVPIQDIPDVLKK